MSEPLIPPNGLRPMMCAGTCGFEISGYVEPTWCYDCLEKRVVAAESALAALKRVVAAESALAALQAKIKDARRAWLFKSPSGNYHLFDDEQFANAGDCYRVALVPIEEEPR